MGATLERLATLRRGAEVKRFHTRPIIGELTVGHHTNGALNLLVVLHPNPPLLLIKAVMWHDMAEQVIGDAPAPGLWRNPEYARAYYETEKTYLREVVGLNMDHLSEEEHLWLMGVDKLDCLFFAFEQLRIGNLAMIETQENLAKWFEERRTLMPMPIVELYDEIMANQNTMLRWG
jgi:5'-deoxynucleotidase YfbR-like HD superfamily hydrolase